MPLVDTGSTGPTPSTLTLTHTLATSTNDVQILAQLERAYLQYVGRALQARRAIDALRSRLDLPPSYVTCVAMPLTRASLAPSQLLQLQLLQQSTNNDSSTPGQGSNATVPCQQSPDSKDKSDPNAEGQIKLDLETGTDSSTKLAMQSSTAGSDTATSMTVSREIPARSRAHLKRRAKEVQSLQPSTVKRRRQ